MERFSKVWVCLMMGAFLSVRGYQSPARKTWWAKRITDDYYSAGRLNVRQIKYAAQGNFKVAISLFTYAADIGQDPDGRGVTYPSTSKAASIATLSQIEHHVVLDAGDTDWRNLATLDRLHAIIKDAPKPLLVYDDDAFASTFLLLLGQARADGNQSDAGTGMDVFSRGALMGFDFTAPDLVKLVENATGRTYPSPATPDVSIADWYTHYWPAKPLGGAWFVAGQIQSYEVERIVAAGFKTLLNYRKGNSSNGSPSQEEVTLLNVKDRTGTYTGEGRQSITELEKNRIDPTISNAFISSNGTTNYEMRNPLEYGDDIGYNQYTEAQMLPSTFEYEHLPIGGEYGYNAAMWKLYGPSHTAADARGPVLAHCRTGFRSSVVAVLHVAFARRQNSSWAVQRIYDVGYDVAVKAPAAVALYEATLNHRTDGDEAGVVAGSSNMPLPRCVLFNLLAASLSALLLLV